MLEQGWQCCIHRFKQADTVILSALCLKKKYLDFQGLDKPTHELGGTGIQITQEHYQVVNMKILTLIKRLESLGGRLPPPSM